MTAPVDDHSGGATGRASRTFRTAPSVTRSSVPYAFCNRLQAGDKSGDWFCVNGDGTMASGSQKTLSPINTPDSAAGICSGTNINFTAANQRYQQSDTQLFPASSLSVCFSAKTPTLPNAQMGNFGQGGSPNVSTVLVCELQTDGKCKSYISNNATYTSLTSTSNFTAGGSAVFCITYSRVGGAADNVLRQYWDGVLDASSPQSVANLANTAFTSGWAFSDYHGGGSIGAQVQYDGFFVTYKLLSAADVARISAPRCQ